MTTEASNLSYPYSPAVEKYMKMFYESLNEKDKRHYASLEANKLDYGGITYIAKLFNCSRSTLHEGWNEFKKKMNF